MNPYYQNELVTIYHGDCLKILEQLPNESVNCCVTSPSYWGLRDYGIKNQLGLEDTPEQYVENLKEVFREVRRILTKDGTLWLNLGDSYSGSGGDHKVDGKNDAGFQGKLLRGVQKKHNTGLKPKDLVGIPWRVAFALQSDGWYLRQDIIWHKPNPMPESVTDRCTKAHEYIFLLSKSKKYYFDADAIKEPTTTKDNTNRDRDTTKLNNTPGRDRMSGLKTNNYDERNKRSVWTVTTKPYKEAHFAVYPEELIEPCIKAGCPQDGVVLDPFMGSGTTNLVASKQKKKSIGIELSEEYIKIAQTRIEQYRTGMSKEELESGQMLLFDDKK